MPGNFGYRDGEFHCEDVPVRELVAEHGSPLYAYSRQSMEDRVRSLGEAFAPLDPLIAYSVKANGNLSLLRLLAEAGCGADIVSGGELFRARRAGVPPDRIVFSGAGKTRAELEAGLEAGILGFNVESGAELELLAEVAAAHGTPAPVALRVNPDIESPTPHAYTRTGHRATKFGVPSEQVRRLYRRAAAHPALEPVGIDAHLGSQILDPAPYRDSVRHLLELVDGLRGDGIELDWVDLGGGFGVSYDEALDPDPAVFAAAVTPQLADASERLILEPGRYLIGHAGILLTRVLYVKDMGAKMFVITDAGMSDLVRPSHYESYHRVEPARPPADEAARRHVDIVGPICETGDFLALDREMAVPSAGDVLVIHTVGAYGFAMASNYNARPRPAEVLVEGDRARLIRRREHYEDLLRGEEEWLEPPRKARAGS